jgi:phosphatidylglycerophosphate synthase
MTNEGTRLDISTLPVPGIPLRAAKESIPFANAVRLQEGFTARAERRALAWLAARLPSWINSDHLTLIGFVAMIFAGASYALVRTNRAGLILATFFLALNWFGDSLDGTLARLRNRQRPRYGFYVDHMIDTLGGFFLMGGLAISGIVDWRIALGMFIAFLMLSVEVYLAAYTLGTFRLSFAKFGPTEIRILLALGNTALWFHPDARVFGSTYRVFDVGGVVAIAGMSLMLIVSAILNTVKLYRAESLNSSPVFCNRDAEGLK